jgi:hypothetical protein
VVVVVGRIEINILPYVTTHSLVNSTTGMEHVPTKYVCVDRVHLGAQDYQEHRGSQASQDHQEDKE